MTGIGARKSKSSQTVTFNGACGHIGVDHRDLEAVSFAFGFLMSQEAHIHAGNLHTLKSRIRMALAKAEA